MPKWRETIKDVAPILASALPPPFGAIGALVVKQVLGLKPDAPEKDIDAALKNASPETLLALKKAENEHIEKMQQQGIDLEKIAADDRDSARKRQMELKDKTPEILAVLIIAGYMFVQWFILTHIVHPEMMQVVMRSLGTLDMAMGLVLGYYYGSSRSSAQKQDMIGALVSKG